MAQVIEQNFQVKDICKCTIINTTHYIGSCTVKSGSGSQRRICKNAPNTITTNVVGCDSYKPEQN
ncbi:unnamed protein product [Paramecium octaurelia]|uniref:Uncharacterized protein n=1 Tax=Paramecium octaurelia TaxID=43137 RepID=A0A8S1YMC2_PAROT|nr:unnamed protein product [Paramecium octaurelia]